MANRSDITDISKNEMENTLEILKRQEQKAFSRVNRFELWTIENNFSEAINDLLAFLMKQIRPVLTPFDELDYSWLGNGNSFNLWHA